MRVFVAIDLPEEVKNNVCNFIENLKKKSANGIKYVAKENLHLTLKFLGEIDEKRLNILYDSLSNVKFNSFRLIIKNTGCFPDFFNPKVLWIGVENEDKSLFNLFKEIDASIPEDLNIDEKREFSPHLTIARFKSKPSFDFVNYIKKEINLYFGEFPVNLFSVYQSILKPSGPLYIKLNEFFCG